MLRLPPFLFVGVHRSVRVRKPRIGRERIYSFFVPYQLNCALMLSIKSGLLALMMPLKNSTSVMPFFWQ